jgi:hypothetical protein
MVLQRLSVQEFEDFMELPENTERLFELINGEIVEKLPSNIYVSLSPAALSIT